MNKRIKRLWVKALRSGRYKQGTEYLKSETGYCCLGVLCNITGASWRHEKDSGDLVPYLGGKMIGRDETPSGLLGGGFLLKTGMRHTTQEHLARMNDAGTTFKEIADYIDKRL